MGKRGSGILLHLTSLPSSFGIGDMGPWAYRFMDFLAEARQSLWQILPLNPTDPIHYSSPYHSISAFAGNPLLISPELLLQDDLLLQSDLQSVPQFPIDRVDYRRVLEYKVELWSRAFGRFEGKGKNDEFERFCAEHSSWLDDFALYTALKAQFGGQAWNEWPQGLRDRDPAALQAARRDLSSAVHMTLFQQYIFFKQWTQLKKYCNQKGIQILGDIPIYVDYDSSDVWVSPEFFKLDGSQKPYAVAGVPPDYFSATGQLWGNPLYRWEGMKEDGYRWWIQRMAHNLKLFDLVRIDHFRGLVAYWEVPAGEKTAVHGQWVEAPAMDLFNRLAKKFPHLPIIAEDLGTITPDVRDVMNHFDFTGMKVLLFAFGDDLATNPYLPHNLPRNCVAYTGTHDNNTIKGWFEKEATPEDKRRLFLYLGREVPVKELPQELIRLLMMSVANTVIFPLQDILGLGGEARMNCPSTTEGNWEYRLLPDRPTPPVAQRLREMTEIYGRA